MTLKQRIEIAKVLADKKGHFVCTKSVERELISRDVRASSMTIAIALRFFNKQGAIRRISRKKYRVPENFKVGVHLFR